ncbi:hypothetical protein EJ110_NYTH16028 [Nymphaea thermarum]|nr:hypothetical protein EJ110_NYTH16028 [Nymphaea thermarum]
MACQQEKELPAASDCALPLVSINHASFLCSSVADTANFYQDVLGFALIKRPSFNFEGAWLFNYGIGIHLLQCSSISDMPSKSEVINPKGNHISFQCADMELVKKKLEAMSIKYVTGMVEEAGIRADRVFFHDPDGYMIEICNCEKLPILPLPPCSISQSFFTSNCSNSSSLHYKSPTFNF